MHPAVCFFPVVPGQTIRPARAFRREGPAGELVRGLERHRLVKNVMTVNAWTLISLPCIVAALVLLG